MPLASQPRFHIIRPHAHGGLGIIFLASDQELHREVALKEIQGRYAFDPDSRARFLLEAEVTGALEHPGIVPVYSLGHYADGRPYYAMRFIKGETLKEAIERFHANADLKREPGKYTLALRELLGRFVAVCNAVGYAHSRGFIHRDIKPANAMLGSYGETLVVDWGLAKALGPQEEVASTPQAKGPVSGGSGSAQTIEGSAVGTPQYMSPEQARGDLKRLGPASDVYSLGATLYTLLTGQAPFNEADVLAILVKVADGDFVLPRQVNPSTPPALQAVVLKAMALQPEERYESALALAADIEHWLADEPVRAWKEPRSMRARRWIKRHRTWALAAASAAVVAVTGLVAATVLLQAAADRERAAREQAQEKEQEAREQRDEAKAQRDRAENNFKLARDAVDRYHTRISEDRLLKEPGLQPLRKELLETALEFYDRFVKERKEDPSVQADLARALGRVAAITDEIGSKSKAIEKCQEALAIWQKLDRERPGVAEYQSGLVTCAADLAALYDGMGDMKKALPWFELAAAQAEKLNQDHPGNVVYQRDWGKNLSVLGEAYLWLGQLDRAEASFLAAVKVMKQRADANPDNPDCRAGLAMAQGPLAALYDKRGKTEQAEATFQEALATMKAVAAQNAKVSKYQGLLAHILQTMSFYLLNRKQWDRAEKTLQELLNIRKRLAEEMPSDRERQFSLAKVYLQFVLFKPDVPGKEQADKRLAQAEWAHRQGVAVLRKLVRESPTVTTYRQELADLHNYLVLRYRQAGETAKLETVQLEAIEVLEKLIAENPDVIGPRKELGNGLGNLAQFYLSAKRYTEAEQTFRKAEGVWEKLCEKAARGSEPSRSVEKGQALSSDAFAKSYFPFMAAATCDGLAQVYLATERLSEARAAYHKEIELRAKLAADYPEERQFQERLAGALFLASLASERSGELKEAIRLVRRSQEVYQGLGQKQPEELKYRLEAANCLTRIGWLNSQARQFAAAEAAYKESLEAREKLVEIRPQEARYRRSVGTAHAAVGSFYSKVRRWQEAEGEFKVALDVLRKVAAADSKNADSQSAVASADNDLADLYLRLARFDDAQASLQEARAIWARLVQGEAKTPQYPVLRAWTHIHEGRMALLRDKLPEAAEWFDKAIAILEPVRKGNTQNALVLPALGFAYWGKANVLLRSRRFPESLHHWDRAIEVATGELADFCRLGRAHVLAAQGDHAQAIVLARDLVDRAADQENILAAAGYVYCEAAAAVRKDTHLDEAQQDKLVEEYGAKAVSLLARAYAVEDRMTPAVVRSLGKDKLLDPLRSRADFKKLLADVEKKVSPPARRRP
jgi:serine/threonine-protein kinase